MHLHAITSEFICAVLWLGCMNNSNEVIPLGSGVVIHYRGNEYLATAHHVAEPCKFNPFVRRKGKWRSIAWQVLIADEDLDIAVLKTQAKLSNLTPVYGSAHTVYGSIGQAMGFPTLDTRLAGSTAMIHEMDGHPLPITVVVSASIVLEGAFQYAGGYVNSGFSGGAVVYPTNAKGKYGWSIVGIITERGGVWKQTGFDKESNKPVFVSEPTGMVKFVRMKTVFELIDNATAGDR